MVSEKRKPIISGLKSTVTGVCTPQETGFAMYKSKRLKTPGITDFAEVGKLVAAGLGT